MRFEFLGTAGSVPTPRPLCSCEVCCEARTQGVPHSRNGPALFVHGPNLLVDTPEEISSQLNRSSVSRIDGVFLSHWHPDHTMGRRIFELLGKDYIETPPRHRCIDVFLTPRVIADLKVRLGAWDDLEFYERGSLVAIHAVEPSSKFKINDFELMPFSLNEDFAFGLQIRSATHRALVVPDETFGWKVPSELRKPDLAILPAGVFHIHPVSNLQHLPDSHPMLSREITHQDTLRLIEEIDADMTILTHIDEPDRCSYSQLQKVEALYQRNGKKIAFAYDTMIFDLHSQLRKTSYR